MPEITVAARPGLEMGCESGMEKASDLLERASKCQDQAFNCHAIIGVYEACLYPSDASGPVRN